ncbi:polysaccharide deacetylase [Chitinophaga parva]|uniref:Polysaccharide deacetylase n=2 Tax=Chitinophaga parva TaxID=2169414 RepID=A0A2T7BPZ5_9BACT|nr:polysaccharide deacetylase [Chitinophaga parva]
MNSYSQSMMWTVLVFSLVCINRTSLAPGNNAPIRQEEGRQIPVLCYHHVYTDMKGHAPAYSISLHNFRAQLKMLADSNFHVISPDQLYDHLCCAAKLPDKPVLLTFDDGNQEQATLVAPLLDSMGYKATFFIMTVTIGKPRYLSAAQIATLSAHGHVIGAHTWDHPDCRTQTVKDWPVQLGKPKQALEHITGKPVVYLAWPFGAWNEAAVSAVKQYEYKAAFQLAGKPGETPGLYTIRRLMVAGNWGGTELYNEMLRTFK